MALPFALSLNPDAASSPPFTVYQAGEVAIDPADLGVSAGDGVFETIAVIDGHAQEVGAHLLRLERSAVQLDLPAPNPAQWREAIARAASECGEGEAGIRLVLRRTAAGVASAWVTASQTPDFSQVREHGVRAVTLDRGIDSAAAEKAPWLLLGAKTLSYAVNLAAQREARRRGADEALFVTSDGIVLEAPTASLLLRFDGRILTPEPANGALQGTTQQSVFGYLERQGIATRVARIAASDLSKADAAWLVSSLRAAVPITEIDGTPVPVDAALTAELNDYLHSPRD